MSPPKAGGRAAVKARIESGDAGLSTAGFASAGVAFGVLEGAPYGPAAALASCSASKAGGSMPAIPGASPRTHELVDEEARCIIDTAEEEVVELLERERDCLEALARALLERETLDQPGPGFRSE